MININPNCTGTFPERIGRKTMFNEMTQKQREESNATFLEKMEWKSFSQELPLEKQKTYPNQNNSCLPRKKIWEV